MKTSIGCQNSLIKNFVDLDGRVFCLNVQTDKVTKPPPKYAASDAGFNEFVMNGKSVSFEDQLEKIETAAAPILKQIISSRSVAGLTDTQRKSGRRLYGGPELQNRGLL